ncbi:MAG: hypothetical protein ACREBS_06420 [Nitrososphaerales archaeon]
MIGIADVNERGEKIIMCKLGVSWGFESERYSFPSGHPLNSSRTELFAGSLRKLAIEQSDEVLITKPVPASEEDLLLFHEGEYVQFVKESSDQGNGFLDYGDTPSFPGVYEASTYTVGSTLYGLDQTLSANNNFDHCFNPVGGLHHARRERAGGFCVFNDCAVAISKTISKLGMKRVAYVDIDARHRY